MMRSILLDVPLPFQNAEQCRQSEETLLRLLGAIAAWNLIYLKSHPSTPLLYESGVRYALPEQMAEGRLAPEKLAQLKSFLADIGADAETVAMIVRFASGMEIFRTIPTLYARKRGDCDNLVCARVAELWRVGVLASPWLIYEKNEIGGRTYHAQVRHPDGTIEDPSRILGMTCPAEEKQLEVQKNVARQQQLVEVGKLLIETGATPATVGAIIDAHGYVPKGGFR